MLWPLKGPCLPRGSGLKVPWDHAGEARDRSPVQARLQHLASGLHLHFPPPFLTCVI